MAKVRTMTPQRIMFRLCAEIHLQDAGDGEEVLFDCPKCDNQAMAYKEEGKHHAYCPNCRQRFGGFYVSPKSASQNLPLPQDRAERRRVLLMRAGVSAEAMSLIDTHYPVRDVKQNARVYTRDPRFTLTESEAYEVSLLYDSGASSRQITSMLGIDYKALEYWYAETGRTPNKHIPVAPSVVEQLHAKGLTTLEISAETGFTYDSVRHCLRAKGLEGNVRRD